MPNAVGTNFQLRYVPEVTWGTTPATPTMQAMRFTTFQPKFNRTTVESKEMTTARELIDQIRTLETAGFTVGFEASSGLLDDHLAALFGGSWTSDVLKVGSTRQSFTFELAFTDIAQYGLMTGAIPTALSLTVTKGQVVGGTIEYIGNPITFSSSPFTGETITPAETNAIMDPIASVQLVQVGGVGVEVPQEFTLAVKNNLIEFQTLGSASYADLQLGQVLFSGTLSQYFEDIAIVTPAIAFTDTSLAVTIGASGHKNLAFLWNLVKLTVADIANIAVNGGITAKFNWQAKFDATHSSCQVTRVTT